MGLVIPIITPIKGRGFINSRPTLYITESKLNGRSAKGNHLQGSLGESFTLRLRLVIAIMRQLGLV